MHLEVVSTRKNRCARGRHARREEAALRSSEHKKERVRERETREGRGSCMRLEVVGTTKNGCIRGRHPRGE